MYDTQRQRQGISFPTHGPASVAGMVRVFEKAFELADRRVQFSPRQRRPNPSQTPSRLSELPDGVETGPLIAEINLPEGYARSGEPLGGISLDPRTGEVRVLGPDEMETERDAEPDPTGPPLTPRTRRQYSHGYAQRKDRRGQRHPGVSSCPFGPDSLKSAQAAASIRSDAKPAAGGGSAWRRCARNARSWRRCGSSRASSGGSARRVRHRRPELRPASRARAFEPDAHGLADREIRAPRPASGSALLVGEGFDDDLRANIARLLRRGSGGPVLYVEKFMAVYTSVSGRALR